MSKTQIKWQIAGELATGEPVYWGMKTADGQDPRPLMFWVTLEKSTSAQYVRLQLLGINEALSMDCRYDDYATPEDARAACLERWADHVKKTLSTITKSQFNSKKSV